MTTTFPSGCIMLMANASLTLKCSGNIVLDSNKYYGLYVDGDLNVDSSTGKVLVYGNYDGFGAIGQFNSITVGEGLFIKGDADGVEEFIKDDPYAMIVFDTDNCGCFTAEKLS